MIDWNARHQAAETVAELDPWRLAKMDYKWFKNTGKPLGFALLANTRPLFKGKYDQMHFMAFGCDFKTLGPFYSTCG
jgi:hypothetical protein